MEYLTIAAILSSPILGTAAALGLWYIVMVKAVAPLAATAQAIANAL